MNENETTTKLDRKNTLWIPFYWGDYLADTAHLTQGEHGAYILLLARYFKDGKPLRAFDDDLMIICRSKNRKECDNVRSVLRQFFVLQGKTDTEPGFYHNLRADRELLKRREISTKRSLARQKTIDQQVSTSVDQKMTSVTHTHTHTHIKPNTKSYGNHFKIPSLGEVQAYCQKRANRVDPQQWFNHYTSNGWKVGKNAMKDWRAAVRTWEHSEYGPKKVGKTAALELTEQSIEAIRQRNDRRNAQTSLGENENPGNGAGDGILVRGAAASSGWSY
jgi:uncharacterized protein YdaU (DUF1376 family)